MFFSKFGFRVQGLESTPWFRVYEREPHLEILLFEFEASKEFKSTFIGFAKLCCRGLGMRTSSSEDIGVR